MDKIQIPKFEGVWIPLITPFQQDCLDEISLKKLVEHYSAADISGFILAGTTGESMTLSDDETKRLVEVVQANNTKRLPVLLGLTGSDTKYLVEKARETEKWQIDGFLIAAPYYTRPSQEGIYLHFEAISKAAKLPIILYNIPYRTGVNMENQTILRLAQLDNIKAVKDCCAIPAQTAELLRVKPRGFSLLVGDDANFFSSVSLGAEGGILASAHINVEIYTRVLKLLREGKASSLDQARGEWNAFVDTISLVFGEPNPAPVKYMLSKQGLIASSEMRLPMTKTTPAMEAKLDAYLKR